MVIGLHASGATVEQPDAASVDCPALRDLPEIQSPGVVVQRVMNVVMPLRKPDPDRDEHDIADVKAELVIQLGRQRDAITTGLDNLGAIHFARFNIVGDALHLLSVYDGTLQGYVHEFVVQIGDAFDVIMSFSDDWPPSWSVREHPAEFVEWVMRHDLEQLPRDPTDLIRGEIRNVVDPSNGDAPLLVGAGSPLEQLTRGYLRRRFVAQPHAHLSMHRGYPGRSVAQIRDALEVGW